MGYIELHKIEELIELDDNNTALLGELIDIFLDSAPRQLNEINDAYLNNDFLKVQKTAHSLKSSSANLGAAGMLALCSKLEAWSNWQDIHGSQDILSKLKTEFAHVVTELRQIKLEKVI